MEGLFHPHAGPEWLVRSTGKIPCGSVWFFGAGRAGVQSWHLIKISTMLALGWPTASSDAQVMFFNTAPTQS